MPRQRKGNLDRKTHKPDPQRTESSRPDLELNRANQVRRDDDVVRTPRRTLYDIDFAIKWFIENEIQPQLTENNETIKVPVIFANGEKWDNVRRLGYLRDEKGMLQAPIIVLKRNTLGERDQMKKLDINRPASGNQIVVRQKYNARNRYEDSFHSFPKDSPRESEELFLINVPEFVDVEYDMMIWTDFSTQMNEMIEQLMPYGGFAWGNENNRYQTLMRPFTFETINPIGEDRIVRANTTLTVKGHLLAAQEYRMSTVQKAYSIKRIQFDTVLDIGLDLFSTTILPEQLLKFASRILGGSSITVGPGSGRIEYITIDAETMEYLTNLSEKAGAFVAGDEILVTGAAAINPQTELAATKLEFTIHINGQFIDQDVFTWTPTTLPTQTITFDTGLLGYSIESDDVIIVKGRWA